jgi:hypothetical protein
LASLPLSTDVPNRTARALSPPVSPTPALLTQLPGSPSDYGLPFHEPKPASRSSWAHAAEPIHSASFTDFEASLPLRIRSRPARVAPTWRSILFWVSSPLGSSPSTPRVLYPPWASRTQNTSPAPEGFRDATLETSSLKSRVRPPCNTEVFQDDLVGSDQPPWGLDRTTSRWPPLLSWPWTTEQARRS